VMAATGFQTFGLPHLAVMGLTVAAAVGLSVWVRQADSPRLTRAVCRSIAGLLVANELVYRIHALVAYPADEFLREYLPVHVCGVGAFLTAWVLLRRGGGLAFEIAYFWGLVGTVQATLTPELLEPFPTYWFFRYFIAHCGIIVGVLVATWGLRMRPGPGAIWRAFAVSNAYMAFVALIDWLLGANYMFLCRPPDGVSPFFFLPWPWYIAFLEAVGLALIALLYLPFYVRRRR
jgi:hypothetical integral membrane protein (TIGR02206 family)